MEEVSPISRRRFLKAVGAAAAGPYVITSSALGAGGQPAASDRVVMGAIGLGFGWGMFAPHYVAFCDVQQGRLDGAIAGRRGIEGYRDFRELLARDDIDAVYIATPDHWHALVTIEAARRGKHIYCQKPLTRTIAEGQAVRDAVQRYGVVFQHGTQQRHDERMLFGCELVLNGRIGQLKKVKIGSPEGAQCPPQATQPVPPGLDWEMWLGPAPWAPFTPLRIQAHPWYHISDYCAGYIAGWAVHHVDSAQQGSGMDHTGPVEVEGVGVFPEDGLFDNAMRWNIRCTFASGLTWEWTDTTRNRMGIVFEGTEGWVFIWRGEVDAHPASLLREVIRPDEIHLPRGPDFLDCVRSHGQTVAPVEVAHRSTTICCLSEIAMRLGRTLRWDPQDERILGDDEASRMLSRVYREPWHLPL